MAQSPALAFDTHAAVIELTEAGMPERQAESVVRLQSRMVEQHFATRADMEQVKTSIESSRQTTEAQFESSRQATDARFEASKLSTEAAIASLKAELIKWMIGTNLASAALVIAAIKIV